VSEHHFVVEILTLHPGPHFDGRIWFQVEVDEVPDAGESGAVGLRIQQREKNGALKHLRNIFQF